MVDKSRRRSKVDSETVLVIGLGRFGMSLAETLVEIGHEVLGLDSDEAIVQSASSRLTHVVSGDGTDPAMLKQLGIEHLRHAVVSIGDDVEASILATAALDDMGIPDIWSKANTEAHAHILERVGATHIVYPERDMGQRVAHQVMGKMIDYLPLDDGFAVIETEPPAAEIGRNLMEAQLRQVYGVTVVCVKPQGEQFTYATPDTVLNAGDVLLVAGNPDALEKFASLH